MYKLGDKILTMGDKPFYSYGIPYPTRGLIASEIKKLYNNGIGI